MGIVSSAGEGAGGACTPPAAAGARPRRFRPARPIDWVSTIGTIGFSLAAAAVAPPSAGDGRPCPAAAGDVVFSVGGEADGRSGTCGAGIPPAWAAGTAAPRPLAGTAPARAAGVAAAVQEVPSGTAIGYSTALKATEPAASASPNRVPAVLGISGPLVPSEVIPERTATAPSGCAVAVGSGLNESTRRNHTPSARPGKPKSGPREILWGPLRNRSGWISGRARGRLA